LAVVVTPVSAFLTSVKLVDRGEWLASRSGQFTPKEPLLHTGWEACI